MGVLLKIDPDLHFPLARPFEVTDKYNGPFRGTWFYRSIFTGRVYGPFLSFDRAARFMITEEDGS